MSRHVRMPGGVIAALLGLTLPAAMLAPAAAAAGAPGAAVPGARHTTGPALAVSGDGSQARRPAPGGAGGARVSPGSGISPIQARAMNSASAGARASGRKVPVAAMTTGTATMTANPSGSFTYTDYAQPVRVPGRSGWTAISAALRAAPGGGYRPAAKPGRLVLSGGGTGPLARMSGGDGASLTVSFPARLPAPVISAATATYRDVLPGVNLVVTATDDGGFTDVLVISNPAAARDPALARLSLRLAAVGAAVAEAGDGTLAATAAGGQLAYSGSAPLMWDTATRAAAQRAAATGGGGRPGRTPVPSSAAGPGAGAVVVTPASALAGGTLAITPVRALLRRPAADYPLYLAGPAIVPQAALAQAGDATAGTATGPASSAAPAVTPVSAQPQSATGKKQDFAPVQQGCPTAKNYNSTSSTYAELPVGYDDWGDPCSPGMDYPYFQVAVPSAIRGGDVSLATVDATEAYSSSCSDGHEVGVEWTGGINKNTDWNTRPAVVQADVSEVNVPPSSAWCSDSSNSKGTEPAFSLPVTSVIGGSTGEGGASSGEWTNFTFRLNEPGISATASDDIYLKQIKNNPDLVITYTMPSAAPSGMDAYSGSADVGCDTRSSDTSSDPYPTMGHTAAVLPPYLTAEASDKVSDEELTYYFRYWNNATQSLDSNSAIGVNAEQGTFGTVEIPSSFISSLSNGSEVDWAIRAFNGTDYSSWSSTCHFYVNPTDPDPPQVSAPSYGSNCPSSGPAPGCTVTYKLTQAAGDTDTDTAFVYRLDQYPSTSNPPSTEVCTTTTESCTVSVTIPGPGPHVLWAYAEDSAGNESGPGCGDITSGSSCPSGFTAAEDSWPAPFGSFGAALSAGDSFDNVMITSDSDAAAANGANGDGNGNSLSATDLAAAGWAAGGHVTVDGATFTLPGFGTGQPDNILAAGQTIDLPPGTEGSGLVFLAASTDGAVTDPYGQIGTIATAPAVQTGSTSFTGAGCAVTGSVISAPVGAGAPTSCEPASGTIAYSGSSVSQPYTLTVPDWLSGPADIAAVILPHVNNAAGQESQQAHIYAFAVPLAQGQAVSSVTLPDISSTVSGGAPALHIFGIAVRDTTTGTPESSGAVAAAPAGQSWTAAWTSPPEVQATDSADTSGHGDWSDQSIAILLTPTVSGSDVRIRLSDPGYQAYQMPPLVIGAATIAHQGSGVVPAAAPVALTFGGQTSVTVPAGGEIYSDPLGFPVTAGQNLLVSLFLQSTGVTGLPEHSYAAGAAEWISPAGSGNDTAATGSAATADYTATGSLQDVNATSLLAGVDVTTSGDPTVAVLGDNLTDPGTAGNDAGTPAIAQDLTTAVAAQGGGYSVVDVGIQGNQITSDGSGSGQPYDAGASALSRLDRDVLDQPGIGTVVVNEGLEDLLAEGESGATVDPDILDSAYQQLVTQLEDWGITVIAATLTPCYGYGSSNSDVTDPCTTTASGVDVAREYVNGWITNLPSGVAPPYLTTVDFSAAVGVAVASPPSADPQAVQLSNEAAPADDDAGDHVNLTADGYSAIAASVAAAQALSGYTCNLPDCPGS
jgi:hypothetical protein